MTLTDALAATTRAQLRAALTTAGGDREPARAILSISRSQFYQLLAEHRDIAAEFPRARGRPKKTT